MKSVLIKNIGNYIQNKNKSVSKNIFKKYMVTRAIDENKSKQQKALSKKKFKRKNSSPFNVSFGPQHPAAHNILQLLLRFSTDTVIKADPCIGKLHRGMNVNRKNVVLLQTNFSISREQYEGMLLTEICLLPIFEKILNWDFNSNTTIYELLNIFRALKNILYELHLLLKRCQEGDILFVTAFVLYLRAIFFKNISSDPAIQKIAAHCTLWSRAFNRNLAKDYFQILKKNKFSVEKNKTDYKIGFVFNYWYSITVPLLCAQLPYFLLNTFHSEDLNDFKKVFKLPENFKFLKKNLPISLFKVNCPTKFISKGNLNDVVTNLLLLVVDVKFWELRSRKTGLHLLSKAIIRKGVLFGKFFRMGFIIIGFPLRYRFVQKTNVNLLNWSKKNPRRTENQYWVSIIIYWTKQRINILKQVFKINNVPCNFSKVDYLLSRYQKFLEQDDYTVSDLKNIAFSVGEFYFLHKYKKLDVATKETAYFILPEHFIKFSKTLQSFFWDEKLLANRKFFKINRPLKVDQQFSNLGFEAHWICDNNRKIINSISIAKINNNEIGARDVSIKFVGDLIQSFLTKQLQNYDEAPHALKVSEFLSPIQQFKENDLLLPMSSVYDMYENANKFNFYGHNFTAVVRIEDNVAIKIGNGGWMVSQLNGCLTGKRGDDYRKTKKLAKKAPFFVEHFSTLHFKKVMVKLVNEKGAITNRFTKKFATTIIDRNFNENKFSNLVLVIGITQPDLSSSVSFVHLKFTLFEDVLNELASFFTYSNGYLTFFCVAFEHELEFIKKSPNQNSLTKILNHESFSFNNSIWNNTYLFETNRSYRQAMFQLLDQTKGQTNFSFIFVQDFFLEYKICFNILFCKNCEKLAASNLKFVENEKYADKAIKNFSKYYTKNCSKTFSIIFIEFSGKFLIFYAGGTVSKTKSNWFSVTNGPEINKLRKIFQTHNDAKVKAILHLKCDIKETFLNFCSKMRTMLKDLNLAAIKISNLNYEHGSSFLFNTADFSEKALTFWCKQAHVCKEIGPLNYMLQTGKSLENFTQSLKNAYSKPVLK